MFGDFCGRGVKWGGFWWESALEIGQGGIDEGRTSGADDKDSNKEDEADSQKRKKKPLANGRRGGTNPLLWSGLVTSRRSKLVRIHAETPRSKI